MARETKQKTIDKLQEMNKALIQYIVTEGTPQRVRTMPPAVLMWLAAAGRVEEATEILEACVDFDKEA